MRRKDDLDILAFNCLGVILFLVLIIWGMAIAGWL